MLVPVPMSIISASLAVTGLSADADNDGLSPLWVNASPVELFTTTIPEHDQFEVSP